MNVSRAQAVGVLAGGVAAGAATAAVPAQTIATIRVINPPLEGAAQSIYAKEMGFFAKAGFDAQIQLIQAGVPAAIASSSFEFVDRNGGDWTSIKMVEVPFIAMAAALGAGRVDAAYISEPFLGPVAKVDRVIGNPRNAIGRHYLTSAWSTTLPYAASHPDLVSRYAAVMHETALWANQNPEKSADIVAKYTKLELAVVTTMVRSYFGEQLVPALMQPVVDVSAKYNKFPPFPASELIYARRA